MKEYFYTKTSGTSINGLANRIAAHLREQDLKTQVSTTTDGAVIVQAQSEHSDAKALIGQDLATTVVLSNSGDQIKVEIGMSRWLSKTALLSISMVVFWWLAIPAGIGMYRQASMNSEVKDLVDRYFSTNGMAA